MKAGCGSLVPLCSSHKSPYESFSTKKKLKLCLKSAILLHLSADPWSATEQLTQANVLHSLPRHFTHFPDSMSFGHMDNLSHTHTHMYAHNQTDTHRWEENSVVAGEHSSVRRVYRLRLDIPGR